jgi:hypothetical protein
MAPRARLDRRVARSEVVLVPRLVRRRVRSGAVSCGGPLQTKSGHVWHGISTFFVLGTLRVVVIAHPFGFGTTVAVTPVKTAAGHSFSGHTCMATTGDHCQNGALLATITSVSGTIGATSLEYAYTIELFCGGVLACVENGSFKGSRQGSGTGLEATWLGDQSWTVSCCPGRHTAEDDPTP